MPFLKTQDREELKKVLKSRMCFVLLIYIIYIITYYIIYYTYYIIYYNDTIIFIEFIALWSLNIFPIMISKNNII